MPYARLVALLAARSLPCRAKSAQFRQTIARVSSEMLSPWMKSTFSGNGVIFKDRAIGGEGTLLSITPLTR
jgi:hypothetical protein